MRPANSQQRPERFWFVTVPNLSGGTNYFLRLRTVSSYNVAYDTFGPVGTAVQTDIAGYARATMLASMYQ